MLVRKLNLGNTPASELSKLMDKEGIDFQPVAIVNWKEYPYCPLAEARIAYADGYILLNYRVEEKSVRAKYGEDNGSVWTDSCMEFFVMPASDKLYYNIECNCIGTVLIGAGKDRNGREHASKETIAKVQRWSSLGNKPFDERIGNCKWELSLIIPYAVFFKHQITALDGQVLKGNFYKCGDELQTPHFLSWNPIKIEKPDFHRSDFFGELEFEG
ncbi:MAG: carbohydrate-binding family 9-like protein [Bacteroidaceae bacterium]